MTNDRTRPRTHRDIQIWKYLNNISTSKKFVQKLRELKKGKHSFPKEKMRSYVVI